MKTFTTIEFPCHADEVEKSQAELKEGGYCWELSRFPNETNPYREFSFRVFVIVNIKSGRVEPQ